MGLTNQVQTSLKKKIKIVNSDFELSLNENILIGILFSIHTCKRGFIFWTTLLQ